MDIVKKIDMILNENKNEIHILYNEVKEKSDLFDKKYKKSGVKKTIQMELLKDYEEAGKKLANYIVKKLGYKNLPDIDNFSFRMALRNLYDINYPLPTYEKFINQLKNKCNSGEVRDKLEKF